MSLLRQFVRALSTSSAVGQLVKPPVAVFGTEGRYATALFSAASKEKALDAVEKDLNGFQAQLKKDSRLQEFLFDPSVKKTLKAEGLAGACDKLKVDCNIHFSMLQQHRHLLFQMNALSKNLFLAMAENGRYNQIDSVVNAFGTIMAAHRGEVVCEITTAKVNCSSNQ